MNRRRVGGNLSNHGRNFPGRMQCLPHGFGVIQGGSAQSLMIMLLELEFALLKLAFVRTNMPYIVFK